MAVVILIDITASMGGCVETINKNIEQLIRIANVLFGDDLIIATFVDFSHAVQRGFNYGYFLNNDAMLKIYRLKDKNINWIVEEVKRNVCVGNLTGNMTNEEAHVYCISKLIDMYGRNGMRFFLMTDIISHNDEKKPSQDCDVLRNYNELKKIKPVNNIDLNTRGLADLFNRYPSKFSLTVFLFSENETHINYWKNISKNNVYSINQRESRDTKKIFEIFVTVMCKSIGLNIEIFKDYKLNSVNAVFGLDEKKEIENRMKKLTENKKELLDFLDIFFINSSNSIFNLLVFFTFDPQGKLFRGLCSLRASSKEEHQVYKNRAERILTELDKIYSIHKNPSIEIMYNTWKNNSKSVEEEEYKNKLNSYKQSKFLITCPEQINYSDLIKLLNNFEYQPIISSIQSIKITLNKNNSSSFSKEKDNSSSKEEKENNFIPLDLILSENENIGWIISERCDLSFNQRNVLMVLFLIYCQDDELRNVAKNFLMKKKGKWLDLEKGNIFSNQKLIYQLSIVAKENQELFTEKEQSFFEIFRFIYTVKNNMRTLHSFNIIEPLYLSRGKYKRYEIGDCYEHTCMFCDQVRDLSSFVKITDEDIICTVCISSDDTFDQFKYPRNIYLKNSCVACCRNCNCHYVINTAYTSENPLNPLCHYCKNNEETPFLSCVKCEKKDIIDTFVSTNLGFNKETYMCKTCAPSNSSSSFEGKNKLNYNLPKVNATFLDFFKSNKDILLADNIENSVDYEIFFHVFMGKTSVELTRLENSTVQDNNIQNNSNINNYKNSFEKIKLYFMNEQFANIKLIYNGYQIYDSHNVLINYLNNITKENTVFECLFCFNQFLPIDGKVCEKCTSSICENCFKKSTKLPVRGELVKQTDICCTICNHPHATLSNKVKAEYLIPNVKTYDFKNSRYHVQCKDCSRLYSLNTEGACNAEEIEFTIRNGCCEKCKIAKEKIEMNNASQRENATNNMLRNHKRCPVCEEGVEKNGGCNHMTCLCGTHFCNICDQEIDSRDPYEHFQTSGCNLFD
jgi:hypothetical protein